MKRRIVFGVVLATLILSLGGCFWGGGERDGGHEGHDHDRDEEHGERR